MTTSGGLVGSGVGAEPTPGGGSVPDAKNVGARRARGAGAGAHRRFVAAPVLQAVLTSDGRFAEVNAALSDAVGVSAASLVGAASAEYVHPEDRTQAREEFLRLVHGRAVSLASVRRYVLASGEVRYGLTTMATLPDDPDGPGLVVVVVQDVTAEQQARDAVTEALAELRQTEQRFRAMVTRSADVAIVVDAGGTITYCSPAAAEVFGYDPATVAGRSGFQFVHPDDVETGRAVLARALAERGPVPAVALRVRAADGTYAWAEAAATNLVEDPEVGGFVVNVRDITGRVATERRYREVVETAQEGIWVVDATGRTIFANRRLASMLGRRVEEVLGRTPMELATAEFAPVFAAQLEARRRGEPGRYEAALRHRDGTAVDVLVSAQPRRDDDGTYFGSHAMLTDITSRKALERQLAHLALHDELTGLANRTLLSDRVEQMLTRARRRDCLGALLMIDVDGFKLVNDSYGHNVGDNLLVQLAERLSSAVRADDTVARIGDDEFGAVCEDLHDRKEVSDIARRILAAVAEPVTIGGETLLVTASVGITFTPADSAAALLRDGDIALQRAKGRGGAQTIIFDPEELQTAGRELRLTRDLRHALDNSRQLEVHYQPIIALADQRVCGAEALVRWRHPEYGLLYPDAFIPVAERVGLVTALDCHVLTTACEQASQWLADGDVPEDFVIAVNVSAVDLREPHLLDCVDSALSRTNLPPYQLTIEVTETALIVDHDLVTASLLALHERGVSIALDDFGTGYSSLTYLKDLPADRLKIDRSFVGGLGGDTDDDAIVASIISLAEAVGIRCIAEGIESPQQRSMLTQQGCSFGQGFLWSAAVSAEAFPHLVASIAPALPVRPTPARRRAHWVTNVDPRIRARITSLLNDGASLQTIAAALNSRGQRTPRGTRWHVSSVAQVIAATPTVNARTVTRAAVSAG